MRRGGWFGEMPVGVPFIVSMEAMERFSYYGFRAILTLYLRDELGLSASAAVATFEFTSSLAYASPLVGGWLADAVIGKYRTILWLGLVYCCGLWLLVLAAARESFLLSLVALFLAGFGTGGIKPCVSSFGADQYAAESSMERDDDPAVRRYFAVFYAAINVGSVLSFLTVPLVRAQRGYAAAFALPAVLLTVALASFYAATDLYVEPRVIKTQQNHFYTTLGKALKGTFFSFFATASNCDDDNDDVKKKQTPQAAIDFFEKGPANQYHGGDIFEDVVFLQDEDRVPEEDDDDDVSRLIGVFRVLSSLPVFWLLYDQQGSVWVVQANDMQRGWLQPEQLGVANPIFILCLLPFFEKVVYPFLEDRLGKRATQPTARVKVGMACAALAFLVAAVVDHNLPLHILYQLPQIFLISVAEILVSVTCLEYSYAMAPPAYRALVTSAYLLTTAIGDAAAGSLYAGLGPFVSRTSLLVACALLMVATIALFARVSTAPPPLGQHRRRRDEIMKQATTTTGHFVFENNKGDNKKDQQQQPSSSSSSEESSPRRGLQLQHLSRPAAGRRGATGASLI